MSDIELHSIGDYGYACSNLHQSPRNMPQLQKDQHDRRAYLDDLAEFT